MQDIVEGVIEQIADFMDKGGQNTEGVPHLGNTDLQDFRMALVQEEVNELDEAYNEADLAGVVDAYSDIAVVALGGLIAHAGRDAAVDLLADVLRANAEKVAGDITTDEDGKILKPEGWEPPHTEDIIEDYTENSYRGWIISSGDQGDNVFATKVAGVWYLKLHAAGQDNLVQGRPLEVLDVLAVGVEMARQKGKDDAAEALAETRELICEFERLNG